jgi:sugar lactone lactonase YvrE
MNTKDEIIEVANDLNYANGLALSVDSQILYCAESEVHKEDLYVEFKVDGI